MVVICLFDFSQIDDFSFRLLVHNTQTAPGQSRQGVTVSYFETQKI